MVTIKEIAARANLSPAAVSRALRNDETLSIAPETRARIWAVATELGYVRHSTASTEKSSKSIAIVHKQQTFRNQIDSSYYFAVRSGIEDMCAKSKIRLSVVAMEDMLPGSLDCDGVIFVGNYTKQQYDMLLPQLKSRPVAIVGIVAHYRNRFDHVSYSNRDSTELALEYLFKNGHTKIGYLGIEEAPGTEMFGSRKAAFISIMQQRNTYNPEWVMESDHGADRVEQGYFMAKALASLPSLPTAVFCANDPTALGAINGFLECGLRVPDDISIVAHDGSYPTQHSIPPLTTVDVHPHQLGVEAVRLLMQRIEKQTSGIARQLLLYPALIERGSVRNISDLS